MNGIPMINGNVYTWADITVLIGGVPITGITGVKYADETILRKDGKKK